MEWLRQIIDRFFVDTNRLLYDWLSQLSQFWSAGSNREYIISLTALLCLVMALVVIARSRRREAALLKEISSGLATATSGEALSTLFFTVLFKACRPPAAAFYLARSPQGSWVLKGQRLNPAFSSNPAGDWEAAAVLEDLPAEPGIVKRGGVFTLSFSVTLSQRRAALIVLALARPKEAERMKAHVPFLTMLFAPVFSQLIGLDRIQQLEEQTRETSAVVSSSQILLSATLGPDQLADLLLDLAVRSTESDAGLILGRDPASAGALILAARGLASPLSQQLAAAATAGDFVWPAEGGVHRWNPAVGFDRVAFDAGFRSLIQAPIAVGGEMLGSVMLFKRENPFAPSHVRVCQLNASRLAFTIKNRRYHEEVFAEYKETLKALVHTMESGASHLNGHSLRVAWIAAELARELGLPPSEAEGIELAGELHDVGMVGLSEEILFKPGRLTSQEYDLVKHHPTVGAALTAPVKLPVPIGPLILHHHERHDGFGYPAGLKGEAIPLGARILALGEVFDAMVSSRTYREALPIAEALNKLRSLAGTQLDPLVVGCFIKIMNGARGRSLYPQNSVER